jgi:hypothetical protein
VSDQSYPLDAGTFSGAKSAGLSLRLQQNITVSFYEKIEEEK